MPIMNLVTPLQSTKTLIFLLIIWSPPWKEGSSALRPPLHNDDGSAEMIYGKRKLPVRIPRGSASPYGTYELPAPPIGYPMQDERKTSAEREPTGEDKKKWLAKVMKEQYLQFRKNLEHSTEQRKKVPETTLRVMPFQLSLASQSSPRRPSYAHSLFESKRTSQNYSSPVILQSSNLSTLEMAKRLRSADEAPSSQRSSGIRPEAHPLPHLSRPLVASFNASGALSQQRSSESATLKVLEDRLGPSAPPSFDPSIVVDFFSLLQLTRQSQGLRKSEPILGRSSQIKLDSRGFPKVLINSKSSEEVKVVRRRLPETAAEQQNLSSESVATLKPVSKRAQYLQVPYSVDSTSTTKAEDLSLYVSTNPQSENKSKENSEPKGVFGPFSEGNDPNAGVHPSEVTVPNLDLSQLRLPQGVRDSLRKYLKPLLSALKPLRKTVPGLPGLDYPILSVVPYTNFYCNDMPWPGFYADTEARCQTWHACDVDGRQATFLCPNGTIFNQALMVCDWWYNTDCLNSPFLYFLNERLFGSIQPEPVVPYKRITPELLDTIFI